MNRRVLIVTSVQAEQEAVLSGLKDDARFAVLTGGVGPVAAAVNTTKALAAGKYDLVINAGIAGGFPGKAEIGSLVLASEIVAADLGAETSDGFLPLDELGFGDTRVCVDTGLLKQVEQAMAKTKINVRKGPILTLSTVTGTVASANKMTSRVPEAAAEAMEGFGVALAAQLSEVQVMEIRAISNLVGPRDRNNWRIQEALEVLSRAASVLTEVQL